MLPRFILAAIFLGVIALTEEIHGSRRNSASDAQWSLETKQLAIDGRKPGARERGKEGQYGGGDYDGGGLDSEDEIHRRGRLHQSKEEDGGGEKRLGNRLVRDERNYTDEDEGGEEEDESAKYTDDNCTHPRQPYPWYNDSCDFVHAECRGKSELIDYLAFVLCDLPKAQVIIITTVLY